MMSVEQMTGVAVFLAVSAVVLALFAIVFYKKKDLKSAGYVLQGKRQMRQIEEMKQTEVLKQPEEEEQTQLMEEETILLLQERWNVLQEITYGLE